MKVTIKDGQIIVDGEGEIIDTSKSPDVGSLVILTNFKFERVPENFEKVVGRVRVSATATIAKSFSFPIRISIRKDQELGKCWSDEEIHFPSGDILDLNNAKELIEAINEAIAFVEAARK